MECLKDRKFGSVLGGVRDMKLLAANLETSMLAKNFKRFAGADQIMDQQEYDRFSKEMNLTRQQAATLWTILDADGSGQIEKVEFITALKSFQQARAWLRFCPDCIYDSTCAYCCECNSNCDLCSDQSFCAAHWEDHPARNREDVGGFDAAASSMNTKELLREQLVIRPLNWAYSSPLMAWLPNAQKAVLRRTLRAQQLASKDAIEQARWEEEVARNARR